MPDNVPPPKPNTGFTPRQPGESSSSPGLQDLSNQAEQAAQALAGIASLSGQFLARFQQVQTLVGQTGQPAPLPDYPVRASETTAQMQRILGEFRTQTETAQAALARAMPTPVPPPLPAPQAPLPTPSEQSFREKMGQEAADVKRGQLRNAPPPPIPSVPSPSPPTLPPLPEFEQNKADLAQLKARIAHQQPTPAEVRYFQEQVNATRQAVNVPGHGLIVPEPPAPPAGSPLATLGARLQTSQRQAPAAPPGPSPTPNPVPTPPGYDPADIEKRNQARRQALLAQFEEARRARQTVQEPEQQESEQAQQEEARRRHEAQHRAAQATYHQLTSPLARAAYEDRRRTEMGAETEGYRRQQRAGAIEGQLMGRPESLALSRAQVEAQEQARTNQMRLQAQTSQTQATYAATPEGRQRIQEQLQARQQTLAALEARQRAEAIAQYGRLSVALGETRERLSSFGGAVSDVAGKGLRFGGVGLGMANILGGKASPQMAGTVQESASLLGTRMGRSFLPLMETEARVIQGLDRRYQELERGSPRAASALTWGLTAAAAGWAVGGPFGAVAAGGTAALAAASGVFEHGATGPVEPLTPEQQLRLQQMRAATRQDLQRFWGADFPDVNILPHLGPGGPDDISRSWRGLPQGQTMGGFEYAEMVQQSGLNVSPLQAEQERLQLENVVGLLQQVADNTRNLPNVGPAWR